MLPPPLEPGQESVWDYPRPPRLEPVAAVIRIVYQGEAIAQTTAAYRVLETSHPPMYYLPPGDLRLDLLHPSGRGSFCEWKGQAQYYSLCLGEHTLADVAWSYPQPVPAFGAIAHYLAFYAGPFAPELTGHPEDGCFVGDDRVTPQPGNFYGGWITPNLVGPFKGGPGSWGW